MNRYKNNVNQMVQLKEITSYLENTAPLGLQESYDNSGLIIGNPEAEISSILVSLDVTEAVIEEATQKKANLIVAHHPVIFSGIKSITGKNDAERTIINAIKNDIAIYAGHTNFDCITDGVNRKIAEKLDLRDCSILKPTENQLKKLVTFVPEKYSDKVQEAVFNAGAGHIGNYDYCGYTTNGNGSFRGNDESSPFAGKKGEVHSEPEIRFETVFPSYLQHNVIHALTSAHPYEEVAYDIYSIDNKFEKAGMGMIGYLKKPVDEEFFLSLLKKTFHTGSIKHTALKGGKVQKIAVCGGSGSFLLKQAISAGADFFVSGDFKYHQFFEADNKVIIADIGHFESEQFTKELFYELLTKKFPKFAVHLSEVNTNPVFYF